jgi:tRNA-2-methylthio-N6-dimethylallyladenosine synthase
LKYSERPGTSALRLLDESVPPEVAKERLMRFQARQRELQIVSNNAMEGKLFDVLVEGRSKWDENVVCGRTGTYKMVNFPGSMDLVGEIVPVNITKGFVNSLRGERA